MTLLGLSRSYLRRRPLGTALNVVLMALAVATFAVLLLVSRQLDDRLARDARGIDLVVGAKGSPLQLVLSAVYHLDAPTGNVRQADVAPLLASPAVRRAVPLALGDTYAGHAVVGTTPEILGLYGARLASGRLWRDVRETVVGSEVAAAEGLSVGEAFVTSHGAGGVTRHAEAPMRVVGVLAPTGTVADRLVLTGLETVWAVHEHGAGGLSPADAHDRAPATPAEARAQAFSDSLRASERELTAVLVTLRNPASAFLFARTVDGVENLKAAQPAFELARLSRLVGVGARALRVFGGILLATALLSVFATLFQALDDRRYDLAMLRTLGASRGALFRHLLLEGVALAAAGAVLGLLLGHAAVELAGRLSGPTQGLRFTGAVLLPEELGIALAALAAGALAALVPALRAYRTPLATALARGSA